MSTHEDSEPIKITAIAPRFGPIYFLAGLSASTNRIYCGNLGCVTPKADYCNCNEIIESKDRSKEALPGSTGSFCAF